MSAEIEQKAFDKYFRYDYVSHFSEGLAAVGLKDKRGFIDKTGKEVEK